MSLSQPQEPATADERAEGNAELTIQVLDEDGNPVSGKVCLRGEDKRETCSFTDRLGIVSFLHLGTESYTVIVFRDSQQVWADEIAVSNRFGVQREIVRLAGSKDASPTVSARDLVVPERSRTLYEVGKRALCKGEYSKAQKSLQAALAVYPDFPRARNALAVAYAKQHDFALAIDQLEIAINLDPRFGEAYFNYGIVLMDTGRFADAASRLVRALDLEFSPAHVADSLISSDIQANQPDAAVAALQTIHERKLKHEASLHWEVAKFLDELGRSQDAGLQYRQYTAETH